MRYGTIFYALDCVVKRTREYLGVVATELKAGYTFRVGRVQTTDCLTALYFPYL